jgi:hypothetical protein
VTFDPPSPTDWVDGIPEWHKLVSPEDQGYEFGRSPPATRLLPADPVSSDTGACRNCLAAMCCSAPLLVLSRVVQTPR